MVWNKTLVINILKTIIMKKKLLYTLLFATTGFILGSCHDDDFSENYDINFPVATITSVSKTNPYVDEEITLSGENLNTATSVSIGSYRFNLVSTSEDGLSAVVAVPRTVEAGALTILNKYKRTFESDVRITPQFYPAIVTEWPSVIQMGRTFTLKGENMDLIETVKVNGSVAAPAGAASYESASFASKDLDVAVGDFVTIEVTPKAGLKQEMDGIEIIRATDKFVPKSTLLILDINKGYTVENGSDAAVCTMSEEKGMFGNAFRVTAPVGNGWNGIYCKIYSDNNGQGFDLSAYNNPCITMLINTNGKQGYMQPLTYDAANGEQDRHLESKHGYGDDYMSTTDGWEWRSYSLADLGFPVTTGFIEKIGVQFRGGNIGNSNDMEFDISVNWVILTDGPLNPTVAWDTETDVDSYEAGAFSFMASGSDASHIGVSQGDRYANYKGSNLGWDKSVIGVVKCSPLDPVVYSNGIWINFLVNTGAFGGYIQPCMGAGWMNLTSPQGYGDDYQVNPTNNEWQWRSVRVTPGEGDLSGWDATQEFDFKIQVLGGNYTGGTLDISCDYFVFTTAPIDPTLNTNDFK